MKKEEILEKSRKENRNKDVFEIEVDAKAGKLAACVMLIMAFIFYSYEILSGKGINPSFYSLITIFNCVLWGYKAIKVDNNRKLNSFISAIWGLLTVILLLEYFNVL